MKRIPTFIALMVFLLMAGLLAIPFGAEAGASDVSVEAPTNHLLNVGLTNRAYSTEQLGSFFTNFNLTTPQTLTNVAPFADAVVAADFSPDDGMIYALNQTDGTFVTIDPATGSQTEIGASLPMNGTWTGLATNATSGTIYASSADCEADGSWLSTVNPLTGAATMVGAISGAQCIQALAVDASGQLWGVDIELDQLFMIDSITGAGTSVGALGVDAAVSAGLDVDYTDGTLYMTTLISSVPESRLYSVSTGSGTATMVGALGSSDPGGLTNLRWLAISGQLPLTCNGLSGAIPNNDANGITNSITVTDSRYLIDLSVYLSTTHPSVGDLAFNLSHDGSTVSLLNRPNNGAGDCTGDNLDITLDDEAATAVQTSCANADPAYTIGASYQPSDSLSVFDLQVYSGTWSLNAIDGAGGDAGSLNCWSLEPTFAQPGLTLEKTVSTDGSCGTESEISVVAGTEVTYCYTVTNVGNITLTKQSLVDSVFGTVVSDTQSLGIGESRIVTATDMITSPITNNATWTAEIPNGPSATADASATVSIIPPTCSAPNVAIPDAISAGVTDTLTFTDSGVITDINVLVETEHSWVGDLSYTLTHLETGVSVTIIDRPGVPASDNGCSGNDIDATLDDEASAAVEDACDAGTPTIDGDFTPNNPLSLFDMMAVPLAGTWELNVSDAVSGESGTLTQWCLDAMTGEPEIAVDPMSLTDTLGPNDSSTHPLTISNNGNAVLSWEITSDVSWASVDTVSGTTGINDSSNLVVTFDSTGQADGTYTGSLTIANNDADEDPITIPLTLTVEIVPDIEVSPTSLETTLLTNEMTTETLTISNTGDLDLTWSIVISDAAWATVDMMSGSTAADGSSDVTVTFDSAGLAAGTYNGILSITSNDPDEPTVNVSLTLIVDAGAQPDIAVNPASLASILEVGGTEDQTLTISNNGDADLIWTIVEEAVGLIQPYRSMNTSKLSASTEVGEPTGNNSLAASSATNVESFGQQPLNRDGPTTITHSDSQDVVEGSIACTDNNTGFHTDNSYIRVFNTADFGLGDFNVTNVEFGVQSAAGATGSQPVEVNLYTLDGFLSFGNMTLIGRAVVDLPDQALTIASVDVTGFVPAGSILVVEVFTPNGVSDGNNFFIGSNPDGQTAPSYLASVGCDITVPTDVVDIGFPDMQIVMNVTGVSDGDGPFCTPTDLDWVSVDPTGGTTAADDFDDVTVTFDAVEVGNYDGNLCVSSNDPAKPIVIVPIDLTVEAPAEPDPLMCNGSMIEFENGIPADWVTANSGNVYWSTTDDTAACGVLGNQTNGSGEAACANSDATNGAGEPYDAELWTNAFDIDAPFNYASLNFEAAYRDIEGADLFEVDISNDGGTTWTTLLSWDENHYEPGEAVSLDLSAYAGQTDLIVRYRYHGETWDWWAEVDEVSLSCAEVEPEAEAEIEIPDIELDAGNGLSQMMTISNTGLIDFNWEVFTEDTTGVRAAGACSGDLDAFPGTTLTPDNGTTAAGEASDVTMETDTSNVEPGIYTGNACIRNTDTGDVTAIPLMMTVSEPTAVEVAELTTSTSSNLPLALAVAGMMLVLAGGFVVRRRRRQ